MLFINNFIKNYFKNKNILIIIYYKNSFIIYFIKSIFNWFHFNLQLILFLLQIYNVIYLHHLLEQYLSNHFNEYDKLNKFNYLEQHLLKHNLYEQHDKQLFVLIQQLALNLNYNYNEYPKHHKQKYFLNHKKKYFLLILFLNHQYNKVKVLFYPILQPLFPQKDLFPYNLKI